MKNVINIIFEDNKIEIENIISDLPPIFTTHDFIWKFIEGFEDEYISALGDCKSTKFQTVNRLIGRYLSENCEDLQIEKNGKVLSKNVHGNLTRAEEWINKKKQNDKLILADLSIKEFLAKTAGSDPVPGGGSIAALNGAIASALAGMVANLTIGKKKYEDKQEQMTQIVASANNHQIFFIQDIDADSDAYNKVFDAFKLPKETDEEKTERSKQIQAATKVAAEVPMEVARRAYAIMELIADVAENGNQNAITDACVSMMSARTAVLGAILNVKINLSSLKDEEYVAKMKTECDQLEKDAIAKEQALLEKVNKML